MKKLLIAGTIIGSLMINPLAEANTNSQPENEQVSVMFGETHPRFRKDNDFVIKLLPELKSRGFNYLAIETEKGHNVILHELVQRYIDGEEISRSELKEHWNSRELFKKSEQIIEELAQGKIKREDIGKWWKRQERRRFPGWYDLIEAAKEQGITILAYEAKLESYNCANKRELKAYENLKKEILDKDPNAKIIIYSGSSHLSEKKDHYESLKHFEEAYKFNTDDNKLYETLGYHLNNHTKGKNLTVDISRTSNTPNVDLSINLNKTEYQNAKKQFLEKLDEMLK